MGQMFVLVKVLQPSQPIRLMLSAVSLPNHFSWAGLVLYAFNHVLMHILSSELTIALLESAGENDRRKYFMINLHKRMLLPSPTGIEP